MTATPEYSRSIPRIMTGSISRFLQSTMGSFLQIGVLLLLLALGICVLPLNAELAHAQGQAQGQVQTTRLARRPGQLPGQAPPPAQPTVESAAPVQDIIEARVLSATPSASCTADQSGGGAGVDPITGKPLKCQTVEVQFLEGQLKGQKVSIASGTIPIANQADIVYKSGDVVLVEWDHAPGEASTFHITDFVRTDGMWVLAAIFAVLAVLFARIRGITSLLGLIISFGILMLFVIPRILAGNDPVVISIIGALAIMVVTLYLSHGFNLKTTAAICGTSISLVLTGLLAWFSLDWLKLTGLGSEEAVYLSALAGWLDQPSWPIAGWHHHRSARRAERYYYRAGIGSVRIP